MREIEHCGVCFGAYLLWTRRARRIRYLYLACAFLCRVAIFAARKLTEFSICDF